MAEPGVPELQFDGPARAAMTCVLLHGAGAGMAHPFLATVAAGLAAAGLRVARFDFPYMAARATGRRPPPDRLPVLLQCTRLAIAAAAGPRPFALLGKSMGGRVATLLADEVGARAVVVFGYPFHPARRAGPWRTQHLPTLRTPLLVLQGERDPFGSRDEPLAAHLGATAQLRFLPDGDHSLVPRRRSGIAADANLTAAIAQAVAFVQAAGCGQRA